MLITYTLLLKFKEIIAGNQLILAESVSGITALQITLLHWFPSRVKEIYDQIHVSI